MFENYKMMSDAEKASVKAIHKALRANTGTRYGNLVWGYIRGFPYRRIERTTREDNKVDASWLTTLIAETVQDFAIVDPKARYKTEPHPAVLDWLANPEGAIPVPARSKLTPDEARALHESRKKAA